MKRFFLFLLLMLFPLFAFAEQDQDDLSFEGKASALITRNVSVPYPVIVDKVFVKIGDNVRKDQHLLEYHLELATERGMQNELFQAGGQLDHKMQRASYEQDVLLASNKRKLSSELAAKGLGSQEENAINARNLAFAQTKLKAFEEKVKLAQSDFAYRLKDLEKNFGQPVKAGQKIPKVLFMNAPLDATVIAMSPYVRPNAFLSGNAFTLALLNPIQVQIQVHESEITKLKVGQAATVEFGGKDKVKLPGTITMLSWQPTNGAIAVPSFYHVWLDVENPEHLIKPGYKVIVNVQPNAD